MQGSTISTIYGTQFQSTTNEIKWLIDQMNGTIEYKNGGATSKEIGGEQVGMVGQGSHHVNHHNYGV